ncbi:MAG: hypothetical protein H6720_02645 [Sandaracinus sp.]|nr:hypothetical protein [Sandaracinus sp.]
MPRRDDLRVHRRTAWYVIVEVTDVDDRFYDDDVGIALYLGGDRVGRRAHLVWISA